jgi:Uma2 family endonuclease
MIVGEKALCVFPRNDYEPDVCFFGASKAASLTPRQLKFPAPDFVAEILSDSTQATDLGDKFQDFEAHGVAEYWLIDPDQEIVEQYLIRGEKYDLALKSGSGEIRSEVVAGFTLPVRALFDAGTNLAVLRELLRQGPLS